MIKVHLIVFFCLATILVEYTVTGAISCENPSSYVNRWVVGVDGKECVALVKEKCTGMKQYTTRSWKKGVHVKSNCKSIPPYTAIATFLGPNNSYQGHAAIFVRCVSNGLEVYDQWNAQPVKLRTIRYGNVDRPNYNGDNFYTILI